MGDAATKARNRISNAQTLTAGGKCNSSAPTGLTKTAHEEPVDGPDLIATLAPEIRNQIYQYVVAADEEISIRAIVVSGEKETLEVERRPAITRAGPQIWQEAMPLYFANNDFVAYLDEEDDYIFLLLWLDTLTTKDLKSLRKLTIACVRKVVHCNDWRKHAFNPMFERMNYLVCCLSFFGLKPRQLHWSAVPERDLDLPEGHSPSVAMRMAKNLGLSMCQRYLINNFVLRPLLNLYNMRGKETLPTTAGQIEEKVAQSAKSKFTDAQWNEAKRCAALIPQLVQRDLGGVWPPPWSSSYAEGLLREMRPKERIPDEAEARVDVQEKVVMARGYAAAEQIFEWIQNLQTCRRKMTTMKANDSRYVEGYFDLQHLRQRPFFSLSSGPMPSGLQRRLESIKAEHHPPPASEPPEPASKHAERLARKRGKLLAAVKIAQETLQLYGMQKDWDRGELLAAVETAQKEMQEFNESEDIILNSYCARSRGLVLVVIETKGEEMGKLRKDRNKVSAAKMQKEVDADFQTDRADQSPPSSPIATTQRAGKKSNLSSVKHDLSVRLQNLRDMHALKLGRTPNGRASSTMMGHANNRLDFDFSCTLGNSPFAAVKTSSSEGTHFTNGFSTNVGGDPISFGGSFMLGALPSVEGNSTGLGINPSVAVDKSSPVKSTPIRDPSTAVIRKNIARRKRTASKAKQACIADLDSLF